MKAILPLPIDPPVMRGSARASQSTPFGAVELMEALHDATSTSHQLIDVAPSTHANRRSCEEELWLAQYIVRCAPCVNRSDPLSVVDQALKPSVPASAMVSSGNCITAARCQSP